MAEFREVRGRGLWRLELVREPAQGCLGCRLSEPEPCVPGNPPLFPVLELPGLPEESLPSRVTD